MLQVACWIGQLSKLTTLHFLPSALLRSTRTSTWNQATDVIMLECCPARQRKGAGDGGTRSLGETKATECVKAQGRAPHLTTIVQDHTFSAFSRFGVPDAVWRLPAALAIL